MKHNEDIDFFRALLIALVVLVHIVHFGELYPAVKAGILSFMMPAFLMITGYLVSVEKDVRSFMKYLWRIALPYVLCVTGFALLTLYVPVSVRGGMKAFSFENLLDLILIRSIGPYWFFHAMLVCGGLYYMAFRLPLGKVSVFGRFALFGALLLGVGLFTPFLSLRAAVYYFIGVGIRQFVGDFSRIYRPSIWALLPFALLVYRSEMWDWASLSVLFMVLFFFMFSASLRNLLSPSIWTYVSFLGRNTFPIYVFHPLFTLLSRFLESYFNFDASGLFHAIFTVSLALGGSLLLAFISDRLRISWLLGRRYLLR